MSNRMVIESFRRRLHEAVDEFIDNQLRDSRRGGPYATVSEGDYLLAQVISDLKDYVQRVEDN